MKFIKTTLYLFCFFYFTASLSANTVLQYKILKDGDEIGQETISINNDGDKKIVDVRNSTKVKMLFLTFTYDHQRQEIWKNGKMIAIQGQTNDDGKKYQYNFKNTANGFVGNINGKDKTLTATFPLSLWNKEVLNHNIFFALTDAEIFNTKVTDKGKNHYIIRGDVNRDLWYGDDDYVQKIAFKVKGFQIELIRQ